MVFMCKKCSGHDTLDLRRWLEERLHRDGHDKDIHVMKMGCMDICPKGRVMALVQPGPGHSGGGCYAVEPRDERDDFYSQVLKVLKSEG